MWTSFIGFMASGKTTVTANLLASTSRLGVSVDDLIQENENTSIAGVFAQRGEAGFRQLELAVLEELDSSRNLIIDTGGGIVETPEAVHLLRANGVVIWLDSSWEEVRSRLKSAPAGVRPLVEQLGFVELEKLFLRRRPLYAAAADFRLQAQGDFESLSRTAMLRSIILQRQMEKSRP